MLEKNRKNTFKTSISSQVPYVNCIPFWGVKKKVVPTEQWSVPTVWSSGKFFFFWNMLIIRALSV